MATTAKPPPASRESLFAVGRNCCAVGRAQHVGLRVDGEEYFRAFALAAAEQATRSIAILAWDFHSSTPLRFDDAKRAPPPQLGDFPNWLVRRRRGLHIYVLDWDYPLVFGTDREFRPLYGLGWRPHRRVHMARQHPSAERLAPSEDRRHRRRASLPRRLRPHRAVLGYLRPRCRRQPALLQQPALPALPRPDARGRRRSGPRTGRHRPQPPASICRRPRRRRRPGQPACASISAMQTWRSPAPCPRFPGQPGIGEVEALYLDMIAAARQSIYIENQYFTTHRIGDALAARLAEPDGPEIVVVVRLFSHGWLEEHTMHVLRTRLVQRLAAGLLVIAALTALTALWRYTPLTGWADADRIIAWAQQFADRPWAPLVIVLAYTPACIVLFPRPLITLAAVVAFGPRLGFVCALSGVLLAALLSYLAGLQMPRHRIRDMAGPRLLRFAEALRRRSLLTVTALRLVPLAPFAVEGLVAAAIGIRLMPFMLGTLFGMLPGTLATTIFGHQIQAALHDPSQVNYGLLAAAVIVVFCLTLAVRHWLVAQHRHHSHHHGPQTQRHR